MADDDEKKLNPTTTTILVILGLVTIIILRGLWIGVHSTPEVSLELQALSAERAKLPEAFADKKIPLDEIHAEMKGANLDKPRAYVAFYQNGRWLGEAWGQGKGLKGAISDAYEKAKSKSDREPTDAMLVVPTDRTLLSVHNFGANFSNVHRGMRGAFVEPKDDSGDAFRLSPTKTVATNRAIKEELSNQAKERGLDLGDWVQQSNVYSFEARQFYIPLDRDAPAEETLRGNRVIDVSEVTQDSVQHFTDLLSEWMFNNLQANGRMTYLYYPSSGREARSNNMIRQWMATVAMGRVANLNPDENLHGRVQKNIEYNLQQFYKSEGDLGWIEYRGTAKLGAAALAMISIIEHPAREKFAKYEQGLFNVTKHLWKESGEFDCFYKPEERNSAENLHNFYPGETLLGWSFLYLEEPDEQLLDMSMKSFRYYKGWHLRNRTAAFIPWHTQAYYNLWTQTKSDALRDWIFEMNDWLVDVMQANSRVAYDDTIGRFYDAKTGRHGVPHASSTGVYIEGLIDAFALAREIGDKKHEEKYRKAIVLGLRSSMQLQFQDEQDMFYATNKKRLRGGMRTTVYDNEIRVDNVQHVLMGVQKVLQRFRPEDFKVK